MLELIARPEIQIYTMLVAIVNFVCGLLVGRMTR
jgi:hypothetical protein